jgi:hypothetical protein
MILRADPAAASVSDFAAHVHRARVYLAEARKRRRQTFGFVLLIWAANARRRAMGARQVAQMDLF